MDRVENVPVFRMTSEAKAAVGKCVSKHVAPGQTMVQFVARQTEQGLSGAGLRGHVPDGLALGVGAERWVLWMFAAYVSPPQTRTQFVVASLAELTTLGTHDQQMFFSGTVGGVTGLADQVIARGSEACSGGDQLIWHRPGHPPDRMRTQFGTFGVFGMAHLAKLAGLVRHAEEEGAGQAFATCRSMSAVTGSAGQLAIFQRQLSGNTHGRWGDHAGPVAVLQPDQSP